MKKLAVLFVCVALLASCDGFKLSLIHISEPTRH